jgi:hypothetical protein
MTRLLRLSSGPPRRLRAVPQASSAGVSGVALEHDRPATGCSRPGHQRVVVVVVVVVVVLVAGYRLADLTCPGR